MKPSKLAPKGFEVAGNAIAAPAHCVLQEGAQDFFDAIVKCRANWNDHHLGIAVNLANLYLSNAENAALLLTEGQILKNSRGDLVINPRAKVLMAGERLALSMANSLQVSTTATQGRARSSSNLNKAALDAHDALETTGDSLIPRIRH